MLNSGISDSVLVQMVLEGNTKSFIWLVKRYQAKVFSLLHRRFPHDVGEGLAREIFVDAFRGLETFRDDEPFSEWLLVIALRRCHWYRCEIYAPAKEDLVLEAVEQRCLNSLLDGACSPDFKFSDGVSDLRDKVLRQLSPEEHLLIEGIYFEKYSVKTISRVLQCGYLILRFKAWIARRKMRKVISGLLENTKLNRESTG